MKRESTPLQYAAIILSAILLAFDYHIFIIENSFAPAGLNGILTMVQYKTGFSISYMSLLINVPLCVLAIFLIKKEYGIRSLVFVLVYAFSYLLLQKAGLERFKYCANDHNTIFPAIISGVISGFVSGISIKNGASTGGMDIVSRYINKKLPHTNFFIVSFILNALIALASLFVYSEGTVDYEPVALCITYCFVSNYVGDLIIRGTKLACKFTVITEHPEEIANEILYTLKHSATKVTARGAYTDNEKTVLLCVINKNQTAEFKKILDKYDNTFAFSETVNETCGNFKKIKA
jgi:uncharacterized membrane-anchored protein YitT (DUF2179 family)